MGTKRTTTSLLACAAIVLTGLLSGCGEVVVFGHTVREGNHSSTPEAEPAATVPSAASAKPAVAPSFQRVKALSVVLTAAAAAQAKQDSKFNVDALVTALKKELRSRKVLDESDSQVTASGEITIDEYALRPTTNAVLFGRSYSNGVLNGTVHLRDGQGNELSNRRVETKVHLSIEEEGAPADALEPLYRHFAIETANLLTGAPAQS